MDVKNIFFAGGGTGGHIYPALAVAEQTRKMRPQVKIHFFVSGRNIDTQILSKTDFEYTALPATGFSLRPGGLIRFFTTFIKSYKIAKEAIAGVQNTVVVGAGGFVAAPVCRAGHKLKAPVVLLNVDIVPGKANKVIGRFADEIFVQFEDTKEYFPRRAKVSVVGCPLRGGFENPQPAKAKSELGLDGNKKILLITGASSGSQNINESVCSLLDKLNAFASEWQIVHLTGRANFDNVNGMYAGAKISHKVVDYYDDMPDLLAAADLVIGRSGAVSVAEYAAAGVPSICMPYPYHKDMHQYLNAGKLVEAGAAVVVDDLKDAADRTEWLWEELEELMKNDQKRKEMTEACGVIGNKRAAAQIAEKLLGL